MMRSILEFLGNILDMAAWSTPARDDISETDTIIVYVLVIVGLGVAFIIFLKYF